MFTYDPDVVVGAFVVTGDDVVDVVEDPPSPHAITKHEIVSLNFLKELAVKLDPHC